MSAVAKAMVDRVREGKRFAMLLCDVNGLDRISAMYGRETGDAIISTLRAAIRETRSDVALQALGGDETCAVIPMEGTDDRHTMAAELQTRVDAALKRVAPRRAPISVSGGWSFFPEDGATPEELLAAMEIRLLRIKARIGKRSPLYE